MDKETLSNYGWIVICVLVLAVMIALASPFGSYIASAVENTTQGLFDVQQGALSAAGMDIADQSFEPSPEELIASGIVPEGGIYLSNPTLNGADFCYEFANEYRGGETMPNLSTGDVFVYGDYCYTYGYTIYDGANPCVKVDNVNLGYRFNLDSFDDKGWGVFAIDTTKSNYGAILPNINNKNIVKLQCTFYGCTSLETAPAIPNSVTNMYSAFSGCTALTTAPTIPNGVISMMSTFYGCTSLTTAPTIPNSVISMMGTFSRCTSLTGDIEINTTPTEYDNCFDKTTRPIHIIGSCGNKAELAETSQYWDGNNWLINDNVTYE